MKKFSSSNSNFPNNNQGIKNENKKHKINPNCFNKCVQWKLTISYTRGKANLNYVIFPYKIYFYIITI